MAHKKGAGSTKNGRDSKGKRLGLKRFTCVPQGQIIVRQRGLNLKPGALVGIGSDYTLFAEEEGVLRFKKGKKKTFIHINAVLDSPRNLLFMTISLLKAELAQSPTTLT